MSDRIVFRQGKLTFLSPVEMTDLDRYLLWMNDRELTRNLDQSYICPRGYEEDFLKVQQNRNDKFPTDMVFAICLLESGEHIGSMGLQRINYVHGFATSGAFIGDKKYHRQGFGLDAKMIFLEYAFHTLGLRKVCSTAKPFNYASLGYNGRCGYKEDGRRRAQFLVEGQYIDEVLTAVTREDWEPLWQEYCHNWQR